MNLPDPVIVDLRHKILALFDHIEMREGRYEALFALLCEYTDGIMDREADRWKATVERLNKEKSC